MSKSSSHSKEPSNFSNSSSKFKSFSISSTKLEGGLQSILESFDQFLLTNINLFKFSNYKWHFFNFVISKEKILSISICDSTSLKICQAKKPTIGNMVSYFAHHWRKHLISLESNWQRLNTNITLVTSSMVGSLVLRVC